jgi:hypothetical protein
MTANPATKNTTTRKIRERSALLEGSLGSGAGIRATSILPPLNEA